MTLATEFERYIRHKRDQVISEVVSTAKCMTSDSAVYENYSIAAGFLHRLDDAIYHPLCDEDRRCVTVGHVSKLPWKYRTKLDRLFMHRDDLGRKFFSPCTFGHLEHMTARDLMKVDGIGKQTALKILEEYKQWRSQ